MSVSEVTKLRQEGKLQEAYDLARKELEECQGKWTCTSMFWVLRDMIQKVYLPANNIDAAQKSLDEMKGFLYDGWMDYNEAAERTYNSLRRFVRPNGYEVKSASELSKTDPDGAYQKVTEMYGKDAKLLDDKLHEDFGWIIYRYLKANFDRLTSVQIRCLLRDYMLLHNERPSMLHSTILGFALKFHKEHPDFSFYRFFLLWGPENLRDEDFQDNTYYVNTEVVHDGEVKLANPFPLNSKRLKEILEEIDEDIEISSDVECSAAPSGVVEDLVDSPDAVEIPTEPSDAVESPVESPMDSEKDDVSCKENKSQMATSRDYEEDNDFYPHIEKHDIPSLISRICKAIWYSGEAFDVHGLVSRFADKYKHFIIETMRQLYFWKLMDLHKEDRLADLSQAFTDYADHYPGLGPSHWHSEILSLAYRLMTDDHSADFVPFMEKWDGESNLREKDWEKVKGKSGKTFPALAAKSAKKCFEIIKDMSKDMVSATTLSWLKKLYKKVTEVTPDDDWCIRNYATICTWCGETGEAIKQYKVLILHMGRKYYLWSELANLLPDDDDIAIGLLLKAKEVEKNEDFLGNIHLSLASLWQKEGYASLANKELAAYATHREEMGWNVSDRFLELEAQASSCSDKGENVDFEAYVNKAEDFVYDAYEWTDFVVTDTWVKDDVKHCHLSDGNGTTFSTKTQRFSALNDVKAGDIIQFRYRTEKECRIGTHLGNTKTSTVEIPIPFAARKTDKEAWSILPTKYGVVDYVNEDKKTLHILDARSNQVFAKYTGKPLPVETFVKFRKYADKGLDKVSKFTVGVEPCSKEEALPHMRNRVMVVDDVNEEKKLFHVVLGKVMVGDIGCFDLTDVIGVSASILHKQLVSDIVRFDQTDIRPAIGDFLHVTYCIKKNKKGKKRIKFLDIETTEEKCEELRKTVKGWLRLGYKGGRKSSMDFLSEDFDIIDFLEKRKKEDDKAQEPDFAFVGDYYVHRNLLKKYNITEECDVTAKAVLGGDGKWKVYELEMST